MADDEELLRLAAKSGCFGVFIGFESPSEKGLSEVNKKFNIRENRDLKTSVRRIQRHGILVLGSYIIGLDVDEHGIGQQIADTANSCGLDAINVVFLTPLPGTRLWKKMELENRIVANTFPEDWKYYTLAFPVARYRNLSWADMLIEKKTCLRDFYSNTRIIKRVFRNLWRMNNPRATLLMNLSYRSNGVRFFREKLQGLDLSRGEAQVENELQSGRDIV
jgi:radical SAM superfamily enzyme YgiQ (UPF0313 family)